jgi:hypothetical protein
MRCAWLVLLGACTFAPNRLTGDAAPGDIDAPPGQSTTGSDGSNSTGPACYGTGIVQICPAMPPTGTLTLSGTLDTATASACKAYSVAPGQQPLDACVVTAQTVVVTGSFVVTGARPLVIIGGDSIQVASGAVVDVSSQHSPSRTGAGALRCDPSADATCGLSDCGGGAGGSFADVGGKGGDGANNGKGGKPAAKVTTIDALRGGCGGAGGAGILGGGGGGGGGAVALLSAGTITIDGAIDASGGGGNGASGAAAGGGGGGAGGMIVLDAPTLSGAGTLIANGGGGGEGASLGGGASGSEPKIAMPMTAAPGGSGNSNAGNGGDGAAGSTTGGSDGADGDSGDGGGGGGGGAGVLRLYATQNAFTGPQSPN